MPNSLKGPAPSGLAQVHSDVTTFKAEYQKWLDEEEYTYPDLSVEDAEWVLEACFNFEHRFYDQGNEQAAVISYEELDEYAIEVSSSVVVPNQLFGAYEHLLNITSSIEDIAPITDLEIELGDPDLILRTFLARLDKMRDLTPQRRPYNEPHYAVGPVLNGPQGPRKLCASTIDPDYFAPELLTYNLGLTYDPWVTNGYHTNVYINTYGYDAFNDNSYEGFYDPTKNYELALWGIHPSVNSASTATGEADECLTPTQLLNYENAIVNLMDQQTPSGLRKHNVKVESIQSYDGGLAPNGWYHQQLKFTWSKFTAL